VRRLRALTPLLGPAAVLLLVLLVALLAEPAFFSPDNMRNLARLSAFLVVVALGQLIVVISRGLDLSVAAVITTTLLLIAAALAALVVGVANGVMVAVRGVPAILATLATATLVTGLSLYVTGGRSSGPVPASIKPLGVGQVGLLPIPVAIAAIVALLVWWVLRFSAAGRALYATGANATAASLSGVRVRAVGVAAFVASAVLALVAGLMLSGYVGFYDRTLGVGYDLDSIAAVVLGGAALTGGRGRVGGTIVAALGLAALDNLLLVMGASQSLQLIWKAVVLLVAVVSAQWLFRRRTSTDEPVVVAGASSAVAPSTKGL
jgi:ribose transport system permease protein